MTPLQEQLPEWRGKYTDVNPLEKLHEDEPWFFLRAQDATAPGAVEAYANALNIAAEIQRQVSRKLHSMSLQADLRDKTDKAHRIRKSADEASDLADKLHAQALDCFTAAEAMRQWQIRNPELVKLPD